GQSSTSPTTSRWLGSSSAAASSAWTGRVRAACRAQISPPLMGVSSATAAAASAARRAASRVPAGRAASTSAGPRLGDAADERHPCPVGPLVGLPRGQLVLGQIVQAGDDLGGGEVVVVRDGELLRRRCGVGDDGGPAGL